MREPSRIARLAETVRWLRPSQVGHRLVRRIRERLPRPARAAATVRWVGTGRFPPESMRPLAAPFDRPDEGDGGGAWLFAGRRVPAAEGGGPSWDGDAFPTRLSSFHAQYLDWLRALAEGGSLDAARRPLALWEAGRRARPQDAEHPYVRARRILALVPARAAGLLEADAVVPRDAEAVSRDAEWDVRGNHLIANGAALLVAGCAYGGGAAARWRARGTGILASCVREQVLADGFHHERSPAYHALVLEHLCLALEACAARGEAPPAGVLDAVRRMAPALAETLLPDGLPLRWRDGAPGLAIPHAPLLAWAARRADPFPAPRRGTRAFPAAGLAILETPDGRSAATLLAAAPCPRDMPGHGHADANAYEAVFDGMRVVASAGTAGYAAGPARDAARRPGAFAGSLVDDVPPADPYDGFRLGARGWVRAFEHGVEEGCARAAASSDGFSRTAGSRIVHRRSVALAEGPVLVVIDEWVGEGEHEIVLPLPLSPGIEAHVDPCTEGDSAVAAAGERAWRLTAPGAVLSLARGTFALALGVEVERTVVRARWRARFPVRLVHAWTPGASRATVTTVAVPCGYVRADVAWGGFTRTLLATSGRAP